MRKITVMTILFLIISVSFVVANQNDNYCHDIESWTEWNKMVKKYPDDIPLQILHALRIGLCKKIEEKTISFETANKIFNQLHDSVIKNTETKYKIRKDNSKL